MSLISSKIAWCYVMIVRVQLIWQRIKYIVQRKMHIDVRYDKIKKMDFFEGYIFVKVPMCVVFV